MTILPDLKRQLSTAARRPDMPRSRTPWLSFGRRSLVVIPIALTMLGGLAYASIRTFTHGRPFADSQYRYGRCPDHVIALGPNALGQARRAAVRQSYLPYPTIDVKRVYVTAAGLITENSPRSADAQHCGLLDRTILVTLHLPAPHHSASLAEGDVYVSRIKPPGRSATYQLWGLEH